MKRLGLGIGTFRGALTLAVASAGIGCSSTSSKAAPGGPDAGDDSSVSVVDAGVALSDSGSSAPTSLSLQWGTYLYQAPPPADGGSPYSEAGAAADASTTMTDDAGQVAGGVPDVQVCAFLLAAIKTGSVPAPSAALACVTTGSDGTFLFPSLPVRTSLVLTFNKMGFVPVVVSIATASAPVDGRGSPVYMFPAPAQGSAASPVPGITTDPQKGEIFLFAIGPSADGGANFAGEPGATVSLNPMSGSGPFYQAADGTYVISATTFIENGAAFVNVDPGTYTLTFADPTDNCQPLLQPAGLWGIPLITPPHSIQVVVLPGYAAGLVGVLCTKTPVIVAVDGG